MATAQTSEYNAFSLEKLLAFALFASLGLHVLASGFFFFLVPLYQSARQSLDEEIITVQLVGGIAPPAPAAPANLPVNPNLKGPDVVKLPTAPPKPVTETPPVVEPLVTVSDPSEIIPIADKKPDTPPVIEKAKEKPPVVTPPPKKEQAKPQPKPKPAPTLDDQINRAMKNLEVKVASENSSTATDQRKVNIAAATGQGRGEGSDMYGGATTGVRLDPEKARYYSHIRDIVSKNWIAPSSAMSANLSAVYQIRIEPSGQVSASRLRESSGNSEYDMSVERAVRQSSPFPPLPPVFGGQADNPALRFGLNDMRQGN